MSEALSFLLFGLGVSAVAITFAVHFSFIKLNKLVFYTYNDYSVNTLNVNSVHLEHRPVPQIPNYALLGESWFPEGEES